MTKPALDPRINAIRPDLADSSLSAIVKADHYAEAVMRQSLQGVSSLLAAPDDKAQQVSQIRYGEFLDVFEQRPDGYVWVQNRSDHYVGYLPPSHKLSEDIADLSTRISVPCAFLYPEPDIKSRPIDKLTFGSFVSVAGEEKGFVRLAPGGYVYARHVTPADNLIDPDYVFTAGRMLNVPYLWGGRTPLGLDCSGLVQLVLELAGIDCPRDSDQQRDVFGKPLPHHWRDMGWKRGDLVFFSGHVGIMTGPHHIIHASATHMRVIVEPLADLVLGCNVEVIAAGAP